MGKRIVEKREELGEIPMLTLDDASIAGILDEISTNLGTNSDIFGPPKRAKTRLKSVLDISSKQSPDSFKKRTETSSSAPKRTQSVSVNEADIAMANRRDPVRSFFRMARGSRVLEREEELCLARKISESREDRRQSILELPTSVRRLVSVAAQLEHGLLRLTDVFENLPAQMLVEVAVEQSSEQGRVVNEFKTEILALEKLAESLRDKWSEGGDGCSIQNEIGKRLSALSLKTEIIDELARHVELVMERVRRVDRDYFALSAEYQIGVPALNEIERLVAEGTNGVAKASRRLGSSRPVTREVALQVAYY